MANSGVSVRVLITIQENKEEKEFIQETKTRFQAVLRDDYHIMYNGGLS
jgi:hypothetical protein